MKKTFVIFLALVIFSIPSIVSLVHSGFPLTDDGNWMVIRFSAFYEAIRNDQFPVRFLPRLSNGYGYPVADFLYPLFMYIGFPIHIIGFSFADTIKVILGLSMLSSSIFTFLWLKKTFNNLTSFVGSICYVYFPYHLFDLYKRGSVGEILALAIVPFILLGIKTKNLIIQALGYGLLIVAHNTLAVIFIPIILGYSYLSSENKKFNFKLFYPLFLGLGLSAFFSIPAVYDRQYTLFSTTQVSDYSKYFITWDNFNLLGIVFLIFLLLGFYLIFKKNKFASYFLTVSILAFFITTPLSDFMWKTSFLQSYVQFPFRFASVLILTSSYIIAAFLNNLKIKESLIFAFIILAALFFSSKDFIFPQSYQYHPDTFYSTNRDTTTVKNEYMPKWFNYMNQDYKNKVEVLKGNAAINNLVIKGDKISFNLDSKENSLIQINTAYFPGWEVKVDSKKTDVIYKDNGLIKFMAEKGSYLVKAGFYETPVRIFSDIVSFISIIFIIHLFVRKKYII
ncbi:MAG: hypothetical protein AAB531_01400 [Patescibacteria group bacterium]